ncbi:uncharacterized protein LOC132195043 isoform X2 [Neocloeon triangulifer]|uniref:uncharacterized protein LOC132195043 isoform X2 n=1 Tax=Neocloeon triangulifer TaxID=2078957 RepID=UPI00286F4EAD|nr:uncharacterized protein LOC132195043 isoform X2 [Neocloeon triangulifer]
MNLDRIFILALIFILSACLLNVNAARKGRQRGKSSIRLQIIKCCGTRSCTDVSKRSRSNSTLRHLDTNMTKVMMTTETNEMKDDRVSGKDQTENGSEAPTLSDSSTEPNNQEKITAMQESTESKTSAKDASQQITNQQSVSTIEMTASTILKEAPTSVTTLEISDFTSSLRGQSSTVPSTIIGDLTSTIMETSSTIVETTQSSTSTISSSSTKTNIATTTIQPSVSSTIKTTIKEITTTTTALKTTTIITTTTTKTTTTVTTTTTTVPPKCDSFALDAKAFAADKSLKDADQYGYWFKSCGLQFLIGKSLVNWKENFINCSKIGMGPISLENSTIQNCFIKTISQGWPYALNFWTSAYRVNSTTFSWCTKQGTLEVKIPKPLWAFQQPDNLNGNQNCLQISVSKANSSFLLSDRVCADKFFMACQGVTTSPAVCTVPTCPDLPCEKNMSMFINSTQGTYLSGRSQIGQWFSLNGRTYMFSYSFVTKNYNDAAQECCQRGMTLLSLERKDKYDTVIKAIKTLNSTGDYYWTSGTDNGCESKFGFCTVKRLLRSDAIWAPGQPDNANGNENVLAVFLNTTHAQLFDFNEGQNFRFICEAREIINATSGGRAVSDECAIIYNVVQKEIDELLNNTLKLDVRLKCFLRCIGEQYGLIINGKYIDNTIMALLEEMAGGNMNDLIKNVAVANECGKTPTGMDECDMAAEIIRCSYEKSPDVLRAVITAVDVATTIQKYANPPEDVCPPTTGYAVNTDLLTKIRNCKGQRLCSLQEGYVFAACGKTWLHRMLLVTFNEAFEVCDGVGMKVASIGSQDELECIFNSFCAYDQNGDGFIRWCSSNSTFTAQGYSGAIFGQIGVGGAYTIIVAKRQLKFYDSSSYASTLCN